MEEKTNFEILNKYARSINKELSFKEMPHPKTGVGTIQKYKREAYISLNHSNTSFLVWFSDAYGNWGHSKVFCGVFSILPFETKSSLTIRPKNIIDKLNILSGSKFLKTGNNGFDSKVIIEGEMDSETKRLLSRTKMHKQIFKAFDLDSIYLFSVNHFSLDFVPELKSKSCIGIVNPQSWYVEKKQLDSLVRQMEVIQNTFELESS
jgi:hypothetical protein